MRVSLAQTVYRLELTMAGAALFLLLVIFLVHTLVCGQAIQPPRLCPDPHGCKDMRLAAPAPFTKLSATEQATTASLPHAAPCPLLPHGCPDVIDGHEPPAPYIEIPSTMARATRERHANEVQAIVRRERPPPINAAIYMAVTM